MLVAKSTVM